MSKGEHRGRPVAIKHLRVKTKDDFGKIFKVSNCTRSATLWLLTYSTSQRLCREVIIWKRLSHPNVLPLLGVSVSKNPQYFRIVSEWMPNGNVTEYVGSNPEANRLHLVSPVTNPPWLMLMSINDSQLFEVASGITYLHDLGIVHGDLKGVRRYIFHRLVASLTVLVGQHPR